MLSGTRLLVAAIAAAALLGTVLAAQGPTRLLFVQVSGSAGPLLSLTPDDFTIRENGQPREIVSVKVASDPMRVALIVDTSEAAAPVIATLRASLEAFVQALPPSHEIALVTTGERLEIRVPPTIDRGQLTGALREIRTNRGTGNVLLDSLIESDRRLLAQDDVAWPVLVIVTTDGPERSSDTGNEEFNAFLRDLTRRAGTVHGVLLKGYGARLPRQLAEGLADATGGQFEEFDITALEAMPEVLARLAESIGTHHRRMSTYYRVEYRSGSDTPQPVELSVGTDGRADLDLLFDRRMR